MGGNTTALLSCVRQLEDLDKAYQEYHVQRTRLVDRICELSLGLKGSPQPKPTESAGVPFSKSSASQKQRSTETGRRTKGPRRAQRTNNSEPAVMTMIMTAVRAQTGPFTCVDIRAYIETHYAGELRRVDNGRISRELYALRQRQVVQFASDKQPGRKGEYVYVPKYDKKVNQQAA